MISRYLSPIIITVILLLFSVHYLSAQDANPYDKEWAGIKKLEESGKPRSAMNRSDQVYARAAGENNELQMIRALEYSIRMSARFEEAYLQKGIGRIHDALADFSPVSQQILHSLEADLYLGYYHANRYRILSRTRLEGMAGKDIETWSQEDFVAAIFESFRKSLDRPGVLQEQPTAKFTEIIKDADSLNLYRPSLYDILAHRALDFYINDEFGLSRPAERFELTNPRMMDIASVFAKLEFAEVEDFSMKYQAMELFRQLISFHLNDENPAALVDLDLKRLDFIYEHAAFQDKSKVLLHTLEQMESLLIGHEPVSRIYFRIAMLYNESGKLYDPAISDDHKGDLIIARQYCRNAISEFPDSYGSKQCRYLLNIIQEKSLQSTAEYANLPAKDMLVSVLFRNVSDLYIRIIPLNPLEERTTYKKQSAKEKMSRYSTMRPVKQWSVSIPGTIDYQEHRTELAIPPLPEGFYGLMIADDPSFEGKETISSFNNFWVSTISYIFKKTDNGKHVFYITNRESGHPVAGAKVVAMDEYYDPGDHEYKLEEYGEFSSDEQGRLIIPARGHKFKNLSLDIYHEGDRFITPGSFNSSIPYKSPDRKIKKTYFFTDRSMYRPGQTVYFKGIMLEHEGFTHNTLAGEKSIVTLYDANYRMITSLEVVSNDYGSFHGSFTAPRGGLTGNMQIKNESGRVHFRVEEYKRPGFEVVFDPVEGSYKLNAELSIRGKALAYSGQAIDGATVTYNIVRNAYYPFFPYRGHYFPESREAIIAHGKVKTDEEGRFSIGFKAIPDASAKAYEPVFTYTVSVDVTDLSGETHSGKKHVSVSEKSLLMNIDLPDKIEALPHHEFSIHTQNLNGEKVAAEVNITIEKLEDPDRVYKSRRWNKPDFHLLDRKEFMDKFPAYAYQDEDEPGNMPVSETRFRSDVNSGDTDMIRIEGMDTWDSGTYRLSLQAKDAFGKDVALTRFFTLYPADPEILPQPMSNWFLIDKRTAEPGDTIVLQIGTSYKDVKALYELSSRAGTIKHEWLDLSNEIIRIIIPVGETDRGGIGVDISYIYNNESYHNTVNIQVPHSNKKLDATFETFRDKLLPGEAEEWRIRLQSSDGDPVPAEMLLSMYDASLDAIQPHHWPFSLRQYRHYPELWSPSHSFVPVSSWNISTRPLFTYPTPPAYDVLVWSGIYSRSFNGPGIRGGRLYDGTIMSAERPVEKYAAADEEMSTGGEPEPMDQDQQTMIFTPPEQDEKSRQPVPLRRNLNETAFFYPGLKTNAEGDVLVSFTVPESLTRWKLMGLAHTQDLRIGRLQKELITQKELMVVPNKPRFFREGDEIWLSARVVNLSEDQLSGNARLQLFDAYSMEPVDQSFGNELQKKAFTAVKGQTALLSWKLNIPEGSGPVIFRITAESGNFRDGEENMIPVLANRMLVTESLPLAINGKSTKHFVFEKFAAGTTSSETLRHHAYTLEFSSNPAWYAVQALPYLMEYPYECSEQIFNRLYANSLASHIVNRQAGIQRVFESWSSSGPDALLSNLEKNQDLKNALLEETPWVMQAKNESERKSRIALLFDLNKMQNDRLDALRKLRQNQLSTGGWPWFRGGRENIYVTQYIVSGFGKMTRMGVVDANQEDMGIMLRNGLRYMDEQMHKRYQELIKRKDADPGLAPPDRSMVQYLYARSFFIDDDALSGKYEEGFAYYREQAKAKWLDLDRQLQAMTALTMHRLGDHETARNIMASIKEHALYDDEAGMYWRSEAGYYWYQAPIETQALLIEAFDEIMQDAPAVEQMKIWLLKQKQTRDWKTTKATADACYALLARGADLLSGGGDVSIRLGGELFDPAAYDDERPQAGTGYFRHQWQGADINAGLADISLSKSGEGIAWGAVYWQYFEDLDKITPHASPLSISKSLFLKKNTGEGPVLIALKDGDKVSPGDKLVSRMEIRTDRDMEFVHLKDMRAASLEPENQLSGYRWQGGLGYYESIRDAAINFFFSYLPKGTWVFEHTYKATQRGRFSNGISSIQCMYAPEFASHSEGISIVVE